MFGVGQLNENGEHLFCFFAMNELCIMNTIYVCKEEDSSVYMATSRNENMALYCLCIDASLTTTCTDAMVT